MNGVLDGKASKAWSHIQELPDEILGHVFLLNTGDEVFQNPHDGLLNLLRIMGVCKRWHAVVTDFSLLWSRVINYEKDTVKCVEELLKRSSPALLDVGQDMMFKPVALQDPRAKNVLQTIFQDNARIKTLNLKIRFSPWSFISKNFLQNPAPNLEFLNIATACPFPDCYHDGPLFANEAPRLRRLHMERCFTNFSVPVLSNLTEISVSGITKPNHSPRWFSSTQSETSHSAPTVFGWLQALQNMSRLRYLTLTDAIGPLRTEDESIVKVELSKLRLLTISSTFDEGATLVDRLQLPTSCGLRLRIKATRGPPHDGMAKLHGALKRQLPSWQEQSPNRYLQAKILDGKRIHFGNNRRVGHVWNMTEEEELQEHAHTSADPLLWLILLFQEPADTLQHFNQLFELYTSTYSSTRHFDFWFDEHTEPPTIPYQSFHSLKVLDLIELSPGPVLSYLQTSSLRNSPSLPSLRTLCLTRTPLANDSMRDSLVAFLKWRQQIKKPLSDLVLIQTGANMSFVEKLKQDYQVKVDYRGSDPIRQNTLFGRAEQDSDGD
ncbi:hypothetical protein CPB83DRAFT_848736 [Crepidotus variabilis]|uniref:F-box domain-containing protein n=1 Tax=Crepidotus variabilis TaxID=179855 RepID=A0A9P6JTP7_9AGAR|nr:hypothetical protein CPB83DRAFT_848736 [Crepidotus variabilis]